MHKYAYWRTLPHIQKANRPLFVTFTTYKRWALPATVRTTVIDSCLKENHESISLHVAVVMPDHVYLIFTPMVDSDQWTWSLPDIMRRIKGRSACMINRLLSRHGPVWQDEFFDHVLRSGDSLTDKVDYVCQNPVRAGLAGTDSQYPWLWRGDVPVL